MCLYNIQREKPFFFLKLFVSNIEFQSSNNRETFYPSLVFAVCFCMPPEKPLGAAVVKYQFSEKSAEYCITDALSVGHVWPSDLWEALQILKTLQILKYCKILKPLQILKHCKILKPCKY